MRSEKNGSTASALLNIRREIDITAEEVINKFSEECRNFYLKFVLYFKQFHHKYNMINKLNFVEALRFILVSF